MEENGRRRDWKSVKDLERSWSLGRTGSGEDAPWNHREGVKGNN
jgi:hypothetical protein